jgi:hypothetical protein
VIGVEASRVASISASAALGLVALGCSSESSSRGFEEPVRVIGGQFVEGPMPGLPPVAQNSGEPEVSPRITTAQNAGGKFEFGDPKRDISGRATDDAVSVAFGFQGLGRGYWIVPVRGRDASNPGEFTFGFSAEYSRAIPAGLHHVLFAAINSDRAAGTQNEIEFCMTNEVPDNNNACDPFARPPALVASLAWDREVDLDLQVFTPNGVLVDTKHRSTAADEDGTGEPGVGTLGIDSNAGCVIDGHRRENLVFKEPPPSGAYYVYANLFDACGEDSVRFTATLHTPVEDAETGTFDQKETYRTSGVLSAPQANGASNVGLYLTKFVVP